MINYKYYDSIKVVKQNYSERPYNVSKASMLASKDRYELSRGCFEALLKFIEENHSPEELRKYLAENNIISDRYE